ncbi:Protein ABHD17C [Porphyridium purpureum]|uniref:Protein ABHD17C n=1 Tax=Porphyridium purpureum TaxID=35688 RepID=A0A5J4YWK6_PORPP|nr:Protein ABHD17C [Porphyridium purpureum]|eukprot:POR5502..scf209_3
MGSTYSHMVFVPPTPPTYEVNENQELKYYRVRNNEAVSVAFVKVGSHESKVSGKKIPLAVFRAPSSGGIGKEHFTLLYAHGNGEDLGLVASYVEQLCTDCDVTVVAYDYTGYGAAQTRPEKTPDSGSKSEKVGAECSEKAFYSDAEAAYDFCVSTLKVPFNRLVLVGRSIGSGPTTHLASTREAAATILISPLASCVRVVMNIKRTMFFDMFANIDKVASIGCPILIVHGKEDEVVPFSHAAMLVERINSAPNPVRLETLFLDDVGHNDMELSHQPAMHEFYRNFLDSLEPDRSYAPKPKTKK